MKKGFTLMEILAVLLVIAVVVSMAVPMVRSARFEVKNSQAKIAAKKMAEAVKNYYQFSHGYQIQGCFSPTEDDVINIDTLAAWQTEDTVTCTDFASGIPPGPGNHISNVDQLFACGFLKKKDFESLPYQFCTNKNNSIAASLDNPATLVDRLYVVAAAVSEQAGRKFFRGNNPTGPLKGYIYVDGRMEALDTYD
ncbi:MAG: prepilin-type N-terminal cleavage/methylation domain-containing protein [Elusimicrobiaceae bacterium]|nr:prepilin-type N-terminal cleavage/methylation domain-containing protein [Elusimicrobiaceae bacterium]